MVTLKDLYTKITDQTDKLTEDMSDNELKQEIKRSTAIADTAKQAINIGNIVLKADKLKGNTERIDEIIG